jgi:glycosyltransferase involved in cell wall biosynthesis
MEVTFIVPGNASAPLSILHVVVPTEVGGMQRVIEALAAGHRRRGHRVALAAVAMTAGRAEPPLLVSLRACDVDVHAVETPGRQYRRERAMIGELCRTVGADIVHTHGYRPDVVDAAGARRAGRHVVTTVHGFTGGGWKNRLYESLQVRAFRRFDAVVAVSRPLADRLARAGVPHDRLHLVPNAWAGPSDFASRAEARAALGVPAAGLVVGWVGRLNREKGADVLLRALPLLTRPPVTAVFVGDGAESAALQAEAARLGVADRVVWPGVVPNAGRLMRAFDVFVLSSRTEGTPIVLFEAIAAGVPVVATAVGGVPDVIGEGEAALVPSENPGALAAAVHSSLADLSRSGQWAAAAERRLASEFALEPWLDRYELVYRQALAAAASHR